MEIGVGEFVAFFVFAVGFVVFLDGVVGEMDLGVFVVFGAEFVGGCSEVAFFVPVSFEVSVDAGDEHVVSDVEFAFVVEEWFLDVFLEDEGAVGAVGVLFPASEAEFDVVEAGADGDAGASVGELPWLGNPDVPDCSVFLLLVLEFFVDAEEVLVLGVFYPLG